jgi:gliding motility-associated-like protein/uncharacterized protein (TIGR02145 family)
MKNKFAFKLFLVSLIFSAEVNTIWSQSNSGFGSVLLPETPYCSGQYVSVEGCENANTISYWNETYNVVEINGQCWFAENLRTTVLNDGSAISNLNNTTAWSTTQLPAYAWMFSDVGYQYRGGFYNFYAVATDKLCPIGWHVPTDCDFIYLENSLGMDPSEHTIVAYRGEAQNVGGQLKCVSNPTPNTGANDLWGFAAKAYDYRDPGGGWSPGGTNAQFWVSDTVENVDGVGRTRTITNMFQAIYRNGTYNPALGYFNGGCNVRCVKGVSNFAYADSDGDGFSIATGDCNDTNALIYPGNSELCNAIDDNCNFVIDEGFDQDGDGVTTCAGDCNDLNSSVYIGAIDITDGIDNNCDGIIDENFDADGDGVTPADGDCNDANPAIGPNQLEVCNSVDDNCNGQIDEGFDLDNDGYTTCGGDCNDANNLINPGVLDLADGIDNDCDGAIDENFDADGDGVTPADGDCNDANPAIGPNQIEYCNGIDDNCNNLIDENFDADNDGFTLCNGDCNDYNAAIYPGAIELDDNVDNNCDGSIDEIFDGDGDGVSPADGDCNDSNPNIGPSALEVCNNVDDNCNGLIDEDLDCSTENTDTFVPTGFSPNNDGFNDTWQIPWLVNQSGYSVTVVNRWEQRVFFTNNFANGWDGTYEGERLPTADYYYVIALSDGTVLSGALTIKY